MLLLLCYGRVLEDMFVINAGFLWKISFGHWNKDQVHKLIAVNTSFYLWDSHCAFLEFFHTLPFQSLCDAFELIVIYECSQIIESDIPRCTSLNYSPTWWNSNQTTVKSTWAQIYSILVTDDTIQRTSLYKMSNKEHFSPIIINE